MKTMPFSLTVELNPTERRRAVRKGLRGEGLRSNDAKQL